MEISSKKSLTLYHIVTTIKAYPYFGSINRFKMLIQALAGIRTAMLMFWILIFLPHSNVFAHNDTDGSDTFSFGNTYAFAGYHHFESYFNTDDISGKLGLDFMLLQQIKYRGYDNLSIGFSIDTKFFSEQVLIPENQTLFVDYVAVFGNIPLRIRHFSLNLGSSQYKLRFSQDFILNRVIYSQAEFRDVNTSITPSANLNNYNITSGLELGLDRSNTFSLSIGYKRNIFHTFQNIRGSFQGFYVNIGAIF